MEMKLAGRPRSGCCKPPELSPSCRPVSLRACPKPSLTRAQEEKPVMARLTIAFVLAWAATAANAQGINSDRSQTPAVASADETRPFLFDGRMKDDGARRPAPAGDRHPNADIGAIIMPPKASQPARDQ